MTLDRDLVVAALPSYEVGGELGRGGWGVVLEGRHRQLGRQVAIKQLPRAFASDPTVRTRFVAEARVLASLDHPHIVPVYDYVEADGLCLLVMEKLGGGTVWGRFTTQGLTMDSAVAVVLATCAALDCAHRAGVLHRDIKPENLMFGSAGAVKVTDFGIAKMVGGADTMATRAGEVLGTPAYMAPEQAQGRELTAATDVYATGMMLYELLSGHLPFLDDGDALALLYRHVHEAPQPIRDQAPNVPAPLADITMRALATDPAARFASAEAMGIAVAEAATAAWGPGWLAATQVHVMAGGEMLAITQRPSQLRPMAAPQTMAPPPPPGAPTASPTMAPPGFPPPGSGPVTAAPGPPPPPPAAVRPTGAIRTAGEAVVPDSPEDLVPVKSVVERPPPPVPHVASALVLLLFALIVAALGIGSPDHGGTIEQGQVTVNGVDPTAGKAITLDLSKPIVVSGAGLGADKVELKFSVAGAPLGSATATVKPDSGGNATIELDASGARYVAVGRFTADLRYTSAGTLVGESKFAADSEQSQYISVPAAATAALLLFVGGYAESLLRSLRRRRKRAAAPVGLAIVGALTGVLLVLVAWLALGTEPLIATVVTCAIAGAASGVAAALAAARIGRRRRPVKKR